MKASTIATLYPPVTDRASVGSWSGITTAMRRQPAWIAAIPPVIMTVLMGWLDYATGWEVSLFIFYAVPIILAVWWAETKSGLFVAVVSGTVWWIANENTHPYETQLGYAWALVNREFYFCVVVFAVTAVRNKQDADAARIKMLEERRQLERDIVSVSEHEQQRIGRDLHDGLCQHLAAIGCAARVLADDLQTQTLPGARDAALIEESIQQAVLEARNLAHGIFPVHVDRNGLAAALTDLVQMTGRLTGVDIVVNEGADVHLEDPEASMHLYRIAQEAAANAVRHAQAQKITLTLRLERDGLEMLIEDDGAGIGARECANSAGMGLRTMQYRAQTLGADFEVKPRPGGGTIVSCRLPVRPGSESQDDHD